MTKLSYCENCEKREIDNTISCSSGLPISSFKIAIFNQKHLDSSIAFDESKSLEGNNNKVKLPSFKRQMQKLIDSTEQENDEDIRRIKSDLFYIIVRRFT